MHSKYPERDHENIQGPDFAKAETVGMFAAVLPRLWAELKIYKERRYYIAEEAIGYNGGVRPDRIEAALYDHGSGWRRRYASAAMVM